MRLAAVSQKQNTTFHTRLHTTIQNRGSSYIWKLGPVDVLLVLLVRNLVAYHLPNSAIVLRQRRNASFLSMSSLTGGEILI